MNDVAVGPGTFSMSRRYALPICITTASLSICYVDSGCHQGPLKWSNTAVNTKMGIGMGKALLRSRMAVNILVFLLK